MANGYNRCEFIGNLGKDPEIRYTQSGTPVANFSLAANETWKDRDGDKQEHTEWIRCVAWNKLAEICGEYLQKGSQVFCAGKLRTRKWEDREGVTRYTTELVVNELRMLGGGPREDREERYPEEEPVTVPEDDIPF